ncbi:MAG: hypothetical protein ACE14L_08425 [Terriglobales bacterium]
MPTGWPSAPDEAAIPGLPGIYEQRARTAKANAAIFRDLLANGGTRRTPLEQGAAEDASR